MTSDDGGASERRSTGRRVWGTEEQPTVLRKAWWILKEAFFTPWG